MSFTNAQLATQIADLISYWATFNEQYSDWIGGEVAGGPNSDGEYPLTNWAGEETLVPCPAKLADNVTGYVATVDASAVAAAASAAAASSSETAAAASAVTATAQAVLADADRIAAELAETGATDAKVTAIAQAAAAVVSAAAALASETAAGISETNALASENAAEAWANTAEDVLVANPPGDGATEYSALHWAAKAATFNPALYALLSGATFTGLLTASTSKLGGTGWGDTNVHRESATLAPGIKFTNTDGIKGFLAFDDSGVFKTYDSINYPTGFEVTSGGTASATQFKSNTYTSESATELVINAAASRVNIDVGGVRIADFVYGAINAQFLEGVLFAKEQAAPTTSYATWGQFWVKDDAPNVPMFTDDAGTDFPLGLATSAKVSNWDTAYGWGDHSGTYLPLTGGTLSGTLSSASIVATGSLTLNASGSHIKIDDTDDAGARYGLIERNGGAFNMYYRDDASLWERMFRSDDGGAGYLYYGGSAKLTTSATGVTITGVLTATGGDSDDWNTAYGWGDHASGGYLTSETSHADVVVDGDFASNGILKRTAAGVYGIVTDNSANWDTAYGWGDHSGLYSLAAHNHSGVYEPADATILKDADIGSSVQAYDADTLKADVADSITALHKFTYASEPAPSALESTLTANFLHIDGKEAIDGSDTWLRLNQNNEFTAGVYTPYGVRIDGNITANGNIVGDGATTITGIETITIDSTGKLQFGDTTSYVMQNDAIRLGTDHGYVDIGPLNASYCHFNTDIAGGFYFYDKLTMAADIVPATDSTYDLGTSSLYFALGYIDDLKIQSTGDITKTSHGNYLYHKSSAYDNDQNGEVTFSTSAPSAGTTGDIWFEYTA